MITYEKLISEINVRCIANNGAPFHANNLIPSVHWSKKYIGKKVLFSCIWNCVATEDRCKDTESILKKLPKGISFQKNTTITQALPSKPEEYRTVYESFKTDYIIVVSEEYCRKMKQAYEGMKVVVSTVFDKSVLKDALNFEKRVSTTHLSIIEKLSSSVQKRGTIVKNEGFIYGENWTDFSRMGMKPLSNESQRLGLALAVVNYSVDSLDDDQFYYVDREGQEKEAYGSINISIKTRKETERVLNEW